MRSLFTAALLATAAMAVAAPASAQGAFGGTDRYVSLSGGYLGTSDYEYDVQGFRTARVSTDLDSGFLLNGAVGARYSPTLRGEIALGYRAQDTQSTVSGTGGLFDTEGELTAFTVDLNGYYDFPVGGPVRPYVGVGVGVAQFSLSEAVIDDEGSTLNLQAMAGASAEIGPRTALFAEARYQRLGTITLETQNGGFTGEEEIGIPSLGVVAGVRFGF
jgi:opacity protein-like surface antigen